MTLQQFEYIIAVDTYRHFAKAAEFCGVTQPTLSAMIQKLEEELGVKLFDRQVQPVTPTSAGRKVIDQARFIHHQVWVIKDIVAEEMNSCSGTFRLGILPTIAPYLLPRFFSRVSEKYPELDLQVFERKTPEITEDLINGSLDAAVWATTPEHHSIIGEALFYEEFYGYISAKEKIFRNEVIRTSDINGERLWLLDEGHCFRDQLMKFCQLEEVRNNKMAYQLGSLETFMRMVEAGQGMTFIPELATLQLSDKQKELLRLFAIPRPTRQIMLVRNKNSIRNSVLELLKTEIRISVPSHMLSLKPIQTLV